MKNRTQTSPLGQPARQPALFVVFFALASLLVGCGAQSENWEPRSAVDEESQQARSASLEANPPASDDVAIGVDTNRYEDTDPSALTDFRETLAPYGTWEETPTHGTVWIPSAAVVGPDFVPYSTAGRWAYDDGYVWVSDYSWGWAPFHYGRWVVIPGRGWAWIPGRTYAGAWVTWAYGPTYVGWAPLAPSWYWYQGYAVGHHYYGSPYYVYCPHNHVFHHRVHEHVVHGPSAAAVAAATPPYVPARPSVDPVGRVPASPTVDPVRVGAKPGVAPPPGLLGFNDTAQARIPVTPSGEGVNRARAFATPDQARRVGAKPPASSGEFGGGPVPRYAAAQSDVPTSRPSDTARGAFASPSGSSGGPGFAPRSSFGSARAFGDVSPRNDTPRSDPWRIDDAARAHRPAPDPWQMPSAAASTPAQRGGFSQPGDSAFRGAAPPSRSLGSMTVPPSVRPDATPYRSPSASAPAFRPQPSPAAPTFRASSPSAPVFRSSPSVSSPVFRSTPSSPSPVFRSAPSAPVFRSAPSAPVMRSSPAPAMRAAPAPARPSTPAPAPRSAAPRAVRR